MTNMELPTRRLKVLNLYAGIGGNRKLWPNDEIEVTAVENNPEIAKIYQDFFPNDKVVVADAHQYLLEHYKEFDFIWSSPPCPTHGRFNRILNAMDVIRYPDMKLYEEIIFLTHFYKGKWCVENVISYYDPLIEPYESSSHFYWSNFHIPFKKKTTRNIIKFKGTECENVEKSIEIKEKEFGINLKSLNITKSLHEKVLNNCVQPSQGLMIFNMAFKTKQQTFNDLSKQSE